MSLLFSLWKIIIPRLSDYGISSGLFRGCRITEYQMDYSPVVGLRNIKWFIPRFVGLQNIKWIIPRLLDYGISSGLFPGCRITEYQVVYSPVVGLRNIKWFIPRFVGLRNIKWIIPRLSDYGISSGLFPVWSEDRMSIVSSLGMSDDEMSLSFFSLKCHFQCVWPKCWPTNLSKWLVPSFNQFTKYFYNFPLVFSDFILIAFFC